MYFQFIGHFHFHSYYSFFHFLQQNIYVIKNNLYYSQNLYFFSQDHGNDLIIIYYFANN